MGTVVGCMKPFNGTFHGVDRVGHSLTHSLTYWCDEKSRVNQSYLRGVWSAV
jgi:hypothetical protein